MNLPFLSVTGRTLPEAWERSILKLVAEGVRTSSQHPQGQQGTIDCSMAICVEFPDEEPRIHRAMPGGLDDLLIYQWEVLDGVHDHWVGRDDKAWTYTYHKRLTDYPWFDLAGKEHLDQIEGILDTLAETPHSRRAQAITWVPQIDLGSADPPCLQRLWFRLLRPPEWTAGYELVMNAHWRSRDALKAAFMNMFALAQLQRDMAHQLSERLDQCVLVGRYLDISDSYHLYLDYLEELQGFLRLQVTRDLVQRTYETRDMLDLEQEATERLGRMEPK